MFALVSFLLHPVRFLADWRVARRNFDRAGNRRCKVSVETGGVFIGRQYCSAHDVFWDLGGDCPRQETAR